MTGRSFDRFVGIDLGGGKGKTTALAVLRVANGRVLVEKLAPRVGEAPLYDEALVALVRGCGDRALLAIDAPLTLPPCLRCTRPRCPGQDDCEDAAVVAMRALTHGCAEARDHRRGKPLFTPYTQRATEVYLHRERSVLPRETLGQGMGPLTARAAHLLRALAPEYRLNRNLIEVYPKATLGLLGFHQRYKKHMHEREARIEILASLEPELSFAPGVWREECVQSDHDFDAVICAYSGYRWSRDHWSTPERLAHLPDEDGWIWVPPQQDGDIEDDERTDNAPDAQAR